MGTDGPSVEPFEQAEDEAVHRALLRAGIVVVEGLDLRSGALHARLPAAEDRRRRRVARPRVLLPP
ncbi:MAG: hypothetical protein WKH64_15385 [Chloroflexia bacterium]